MIRQIALLGLLAACTTETAVPTMSGLKTAQYLCADGAKLAASYGDDGNVKLTVKGETFTLLAEEAASGARYGWPSDGSSYVWWTKGDEGTLFWKDGSKGGSESVLHAECKEQ